MPTKKPNQVIKIIEKIFKDPGIIYGLKEFESIDIEKVLYISEEEKGRFFIKEMTLPLSLPVT